MAEDGLAIQKVPDKSSGERLVRFDPETGERKLVNPDTPGEDHEAWPLAGVRIMNESPPKKAMMSQSYVAAARHEGWIEATGEEIVFKPGGPTDNPWGTTHTFVHLKKITLKTLDGDVTYNVVRQPDKYTGKKNGTGSPTDVAGDPETSVDWFYMLELADG
jgi:hypothetical protein